MDSSPPPPGHRPTCESNVSETNQPVQEAAYDPSGQQMAHSGSPASASGWNASYCGFCTPCGLCLETWCCPCLTFGKTSHRMRSGGNMETYESCNASVRPPLFCHFA